MGDEDFYYEETEVDEATYRAIFGLAGRAQCVGGPVGPAGEHHGASGAAAAAAAANPSAGGAHHLGVCLSPGHCSDGLSSGQSFASSSPASSPVCSADSTNSNCSCSFAAAGQPSACGLFRSSCASSASQQLIGASNPPALDWIHYLAEQQQQQQYQPQHQTRIVMMTTTQQQPPSNLNHHQQQQQKHQFEAGSGKLAAAKQPNLQFAMQLANGMLEGAGGATYGPRGARGGARRPRAQVKRLANPDQDECNQEPREDRLRRARSRGAGAARRTPTRSPRRPSNLPKSHLNQSHQKQNPSQQFFHQATPMAPGPQLGPPAGDGQRQHQQRSRPHAGKLIKSLNNLQNQLDQDERDQSATAGKLRTAQADQLRHATRTPQVHSQARPQPPLQQQQQQPPTPPTPATGHRRGRGENRKCRKVYGMERRDLWCTQCKWKKACSRFCDQRDA